ncbi:MAG TPA: hypothetical protein VMW08_06075 [Acidimicrobiales bacterium]|nr:hypothetical protein [Acidimicrobiales bacterium]
MSARTAALALALCIAIAGAGCSDDDEAAAPTTTEATTTTTAAPTTAAPTTSTTAATTTTTESEVASTSPDALAADGIQTAEDAAVFVVTSWIAGDRAAASRHAEAGALDSLFSSPAPAADTIELIECDSADLVRFDCFFAAEGEIIIIGVDRLRVVDAEIDND